jgi:hypothetical protein
MSSYFSPDQNKNVLIRAYMGFCSSPIAEKLSEADDIKLSEEIYDML